MWKGSFTLPQVPGFLSGTWPFPQSPLSLFSRSSLFSHHLLCMFLGENPWTGRNRGGDSSGFSLGLTLGRSGARQRLFHRFVVGGPLGLTSELPSSFSEFSDCSLRLVIVQYHVSGLALVSPSKYLSV